MVSHPIGRRMQGLLFAMSIFLGFSAACADNQASDSDVDRSSEVGSAGDVSAEDTFFGGEADETTDPFVGGIDVPDGARLFNLSVYPPEETLTGGTYSAVWNFDDDVSHDDLVAFYDQVAPVGADLPGWTWCRRDSNSETPSETRLWYHPGTAEVLGISIMGSAVSITIDGSGPCDPNDAFNV